jgi:hypothetical protein
MKKLITILLVILSFSWCLIALPALALDVEVGQQVQLKARIDEGIPLHRDSSPSLFDRVKDGTIVKVLDTANDQSWINIETPDGKKGWIVERYVAQVLDRLVLPNDNDNNSSDLVDDILTKVWTSANACDAVVNSGRLLSRPAPDTLRLASWNIRWFPDGQPGSGDSNQKTDLDWLACTIAWMDVDALAIQEIKTTPDASNAWNTVIQKLRDYTGDNWEVILNTCGDSNSQHLGFLYNLDKLQASGTREVWQYNGRATSASNACQDSLRPGYLAYFQSLTDDGFDFYAVSIHSDSGRENKDITTRRNAIERIDEVTPGLINIDGDIVFLGDFNTMGIDRGITAETEIEELKDKIATESPNFQLVTVKPSCTHYFQERPSWLDHIFVTNGTKELIATNASVQGYCALNSCNSINGSLPQAAVSLSDHCPIVIDFKNSDIDS